MCVSSALAMFASTKGYIGSVTHPAYGFIHVVGYQNEAVNLFGGPNSMILPFPTKAEMGPENVIDLGEHKGILDEMVERFLEPEEKGRGLLNLSLNSISKGYVKVFQHGIYHVVLASSPKLVPAALEQVPPEKRPNISSSLMEWYSWQYPGHSIAVCCFSNTLKAQGEPLFWWYKPRTDDAPLFFPAVDSHNGRNPNLHATVLVDHAIVTGHNVDRLGLVKNDWKGRLPPRIADFLSDYLYGWLHEKEEMRNADFFVLGGSLKRALGSEVYGA